MPRRLLLLLVSSGSLLAASCGVACGPAAAAPKASEPTVLPVAPAAPAAAGPKGAAGPGANADSSRRGASDALKRAWPLEEPSYAIYADVDGLMKTKLMTDVARTVLLLAGTQMSALQKKCVEQALAGARELAMGSRDGASILISRFDPAAAKTLGACVTAFGDAKPLTLAGASEAWTMGRDVSAVTSTGLFLNGSRSSVESALAGKNSGASLAAVSLGEGEYVAWSAQIFEDSRAMRGSILVTGDRFRVAADGDAPNEEIARRIEQEAAKSSLEAHVPRLGVSGEEAKAMGRLIAAVDVRREGRHVALTFDLRGPPERQAADLSAAATLGISGVRQYLSAAKQAEAKNTVGQIAKDVVTDWEREEAPPALGVPAKKKRLVSYPAVPKTVPKGVKYQSSAADWKPWAPLRFEMSSPQYYQYEIKAAKDGESAEIIARGDLNGDGKTSEFKILVKVDRKDDRLRVAPSILETNPGE